VVVGPAAAAAARAGPTRHAHQSMVKDLFTKTLSLLWLDGGRRESGALKHERLFASLSLAVIKLQRQRRKMQQQQHQRTHSCYSLLLTCVYSVRTSSNSPPAACKSIRRRQNPLAHGMGAPVRPWPQKALIPPDDDALVCGRRMRASFLGARL
jgi:hypothetical protein